MDSLHFVPIEALEDGVRRTEDVDSILASLTSLEPLQCDTSCVVYTQPLAVSRCRNVKLLRYYAKRVSFVGGTESSAAELRAAGGAAAVTDCHVRDDVPFSEFRLATIDGSLLFVLFQYDGNSEVLREVPARANPGKDSRSQVCASKFMRHIVLRACRSLREDTETTRGGVAFAGANIDREYRVFQRDFRDFARQVTDALERTDLREVCGISFLRFYVAQHGLRLDKSRAGELLARTLRVDDVHVDVLQVHRADTLVCDNDDDVLLVKLSGRVTREHDSLAAMYRGCTRLDDKVDKYRAGYLHQFGYFCRHAAGRYYPQRLVTFAQAYNSAAKMARPVDAGYLPALVIAGGYLPGNVTDKDLRNLGDETRQHARDLVSYCRNFVQRGHALRIEEVVTFDRLCVARRFRTSISNCINDLGVLSSGVPTITARALVERRLIARVAGWGQHFSDSVGGDLALISSMVRQCTSSGRRSMSVAERSAIDTAFIPPYQVARMARAEMRVMYFAHGRSRTFNYGLLRTVFHGGSEAAAVDAERGLVTLNSCADIDETTDITDEMVPLYAARVHGDIAQAVQHIFQVQRRFPASANRVSNAHVYVVCCCATWAYTTNMLTAKYMRERPIDWATFVGGFVSGTAAEEEEEEREIHGKDAVPSATAPAFSLGMFLHQFLSVNWQDCRYVKITRTVAAERVVLALTREPATKFARILRSSITRPALVEDEDEDDVTHRRFVEDIRRAAAHFDVFPNAVLTPKADLHSWVLVTHTHRSQVTVTQARELMRRARMTRKKTQKRKAGARGRARGKEGKRRRTILSSSGSTAAEEEEESAAVVIIISSSSSSSSGGGDAPETEPVAGTAKMTLPPPRSIEGATPTAQTDDEPDAATPGRPLRTPKARIIRSIRFSVTHDETLLRHALRISNVTTFKMWSSFKKENPRLFARCRVRDIIARLQQLARGVGEKRFKEDNAQALKALRGLYR